jgi:LPXTG-site transpeptidase (sortase) family protein
MYYTGFMTVVDKNSICDTLFLLSMRLRFITLAVILLFVGLVTHAFAQEVPVDTSSITRAGAVSLLVESDPGLKSRMQYFAQRLPPMPLFDDTDYSQWYAPYIEAAFEAGIITGNNERTFRPGDFITEEEAIMINARFYAMKNAAMLAEMQSAESGNWFNGAVLASVHNGLKLPFPIRLGQPVRRSDLYNLMLSMNIQNPHLIAVTYKPKPAPVIVTASVQKNNQLRGPRPISQVLQRQPQNPAPAAVVATQTQPQQQVQPQQQTAPAPSAKPFAITMPSLGITDLAVIHPTDPFTKDGLLAPLKAGVGHLFSYPGKGGKILVYGHSSSFPWDVSKYTKIFRQINKLQVGDIINVTYNGTVYSYKVSKKQTVLAEDMSVYQQSGGGEELILYTCWPPDSIKERYLVHAVPVANVAANQ